MKDRILSNWSFIRLLRLALGVAIVIHGLYTKEWLFVAVGGFFAYLPLMNIGCGGASNCSAPISKTDNNSEDITYEEVR